MKGNIITILSTFFLLIQLHLYSEQWQVLGTRAMGMGGAYVAMARGPIAQYYNPAGLNQLSSQTFSGIEIQGGAGIEATGGLLSDVSKITDLSKEIDALKQTQQSGVIDSNQISAFIKTLSILGEINKKDDVGTLVEICGGINIKVSKLAVSLNNFSSIGANPFIDVKNIAIKSQTAGSNIPSDTSDPGQDYAQAKSNLEAAINTIGLENIKNILCGSDSDCKNKSALSSSGNFSNALINQAKTSGATPSDILNFSQEALKYSSEAAPIVSNFSGVSFSSNTSSLNLKAGSFTELSIGYALGVKWVEGLNMGWNIKLIRGQIAEKTFMFIGEDKTKDAFKDILDKSRTSTKPSIDIGFLWNVNEKYPGLPFKPRLGLTIRNITSPSFDGPYGKYTLDRQARLGLAFSPMNWWHFAMDIDITKNKTEVDGFYSRQIAFGTEINILNTKAFNLPLRLGITKNLAESDSKSMYTAGIGLTFAYLHFDAAVGVSSGKQTIDNNKYPEKAQGVISLGVLF